MSPLLNPFRPATGRLRVLPDDPDDVVGPRPAGSHRPHSAARMAMVRGLVEQTALTCREIEAKTGVDHTTISRWTRECQWQRHPFAPRSTDTRRARAPAPG